MATSTYGLITDMLIGDVTVDDSVKQRHVDQAADEVDSKLGFLYPTPFTEVALSRPGWLLIRRLANFIASGRLIMEIDQGGEENIVHKYGMSLLQQAEDAMCIILDGSVNLLPGDDGSGAGDAPVNGMLIGNVDKFATVDAFYDYMAKPPIFPDPRYPYDPWIPDRFSNQPGVWGPR